MCIITHWVLLISELMVFNVTGYKEAGKAPKGGTVEGLPERWFCSDGEWVAVTQPHAAGRQAGKGTAVAGEVMEGDQTKRAYVPRAQQEGTKISNKEIVGFVQGKTIHSPGRSKRCWAWSRLNQKSRLRPFTFWKSVQSGLESLKGCLKVTRNHRHVVMGSDMFKDEWSRGNINMDSGEVSEWGEPLKEGIIIRGES